MEPKAVARVGDKVVMTGSSVYDKDLTMGETYIVTKVWQSGDVFITDDVGEQNALFANQYEVVVEPITESPANPEPSGKIVSDGSSTDYYLLPPGATDLLDLIEHKRMGFGLGNIFKACYRLGEKGGTDAAYDLRKIIFFATRELARVEKTSV